MLVGNLRFSLPAILEWEMANSVVGSAAAAVSDEAESPAAPSEPAKRWHEIIREQAQRGSIPRRSLNRCPCFWPKVHRFGHLSLEGAEATGFGTTAHGELGIIEYRCEPLRKAGGFVTSTELPPRACRSPCFFFRALRQFSI
jgi:hypothetical protein